MDFTTAGERLREARNSMGLTQKELGDKVGRAESSIAKYEKGEVEIPFSVFEAIADVLQADVFWLMYGKSKEEFGADNDAAFIKAKQQPMKVTLATTELYQSYGFSFEIVDDGKAWKVTDPSGKETVFSDTIQNKERMMYGTAIVRELKDYALYLHDKVVKEIKG